MELKTGDKVQLVSGGPEMTVRGIVGDGSFSKEENYIQISVKRLNEGDVYCQWFDGSKLEEAAFRVLMLKKL